MNRKELRAEIKKLRWFHQIDLREGIVTPGADKSARKLGQIQMPGDLTGKTVLDIGAWDGFFSFEAEKRHAQRVLAVDSFCWGGGGWGTQDGFNLARKALGSKVKDQEMEVLDISPSSVGEFDVVFYLGVFYHMKYPMQALERVASVTKDLLIIETIVDLLDVKPSALAYYPNSELEGDHTSWYGPNLPALEEMLRSVGFNNLKLVHKSPRWWRAGRAGKLAMKGRAKFFRACRQARVAYHARKG